MVGGGAKMGGAQILHSLATQFTSHTVNAKKGGHGLFFSDIRYSQFSGRAACILQRLKEG